MIQIRSISSNFLDNHVKICKCMNLRILFISLNQSEWVYIFYYKILLCIISYEYPSLKKYII